MISLLSRAPFRTGALGTISVSLDDLEMLFTTPEDMVIATTILPTSETQTKVAKNMCHHPDWEAFKLKYKQKSKD